MTQLQVLDVTPTAAPRQSPRDKWKPSKAVQVYRAFRDEIGYKIDELPADFFHVFFLLPMPPSWSDKKKSETVGWPHTQKPDKDNLEKGLVDAVYRNRDDAHIWNGASTKLWAYHGAILISTDFIPIFELPVDLAELVRGSWTVYDRTPVV